MSSNTLNTIHKKSNKMKNLKKIFGLLAVLAISGLTALTFSSCSSDDDDNGVDIQYTLKVGSNDFTQTEMNAIFDQFKKQGIKESWSERKNPEEIAERIKYWGIYADVSNAELLQRTWTGTYTATITANYNGRSTEIKKFTFAPTSGTDDQKVEIKYSFKGGSIDGTQTEGNAISNAFRNRGIKESFDEDYPLNRVSTRIAYWKAYAALVDYELQQKTWSANYTYTFTAEYNNQTVTIGTYNYKKK